MDLQRSETPLAEARDKPRSNLAMRLTTAVVAAPVLLWSMFRGPDWSFVIIIASAAALAAYELGTMVLSGDRWGRLWVVAASLALFFAIAYADRSTLLAVLLPVIIVGMLLGLRRPEPLPEAGTRMAWLLGAPFYVGGTVSTLVLLHQRSDGAGWVLLAMLLAWLGDTGGYFAGRRFGKTRLYARVSPKKTWEGSLGGLLGSTVGALAAHYFFLRSLPLVSALLLAFVAAALGQAGDLCESLLKRSTGHKDSGFVVPGHGGMLDRIDALMFTSTATWMYAEWLAPMAEAVAVSL